MGMNDWIDGQVTAVLADCGIELPGGDPAAIRTIAGQWSTMGDNLAEVHSGLNYHVDSLEPQDWVGEARNGFSQFWSGQAQSIDGMSGKLHDVAKGLHDYADQVEEINKEIVDTCVEIAEMIGAGAILTFVTAGISDAVGDVAAATRIAKVAELVEKFSQAAEKITEWLKKIRTMVEDFLKAFKENVFSTKGLINFGGNFVADSGSKILSQYQTGQPIDWKHDIEDGAIDAAGTTFTNGLIGGIGRNPASTLSGAFSSAAGGEIQDFADNELHDHVDSGFSSHDWQSQVGDAFTNGVTGAFGNAANVGIANRLGDGAVPQLGGVAANTAINTGGSDEENYLQDKTGFK